MGKAGRRQKLGPALLIYIQMASYPNNKDAARGLKIQKEAVSTADG
jgi:hypothetical protein